MKKLIYLDNAATTYPKPEIVYSTVNDYLRNSCVNAGRGSYGLAREAAEIIEETRLEIIKLVNGSNSERVIFSPSATIAINQLLRGLDFNNIKNIYVSPFEHNAIMRTLHSLNKTNDFEVHIIPFDNITFELNIEELKIMYSKNNPDLLIMSHVSNTTGYILPIKECSILAKDYNPITIVDCAQSLGTVNVDLRNEFSEVDFIIFAAHKSLYGVFGLGGFISIGNRVKLNEVITGGTGSDSTNLEMPLDDEKGYEAGSYNSYAIAGLNSAVKWINKVGRENIYNHEKELSDKLINGLIDLEGLEIYIPENLDKHIGIVSFNIDGFKAGDIGRILNDEFNISVRTGYHCAPLIGEFLDGYAKDGIVRVSMGYFNSLDDIEVFIKVIREIIGG